MGKGWSSSLVVKSSNAGIQHIFTQGHPIFLGAPYFIYLSDLLHLTDQVKSIIIFFHGFPRYQLKIRHVGSSSQKLFWNNYQLIWANSSHIWGWPLGTSCGHSIGLGRYLGKTENYGRFFLPIWIQLHLYNGGDPADEDITKKLCRLMQCELIQNWMLIFLKILW